MMEDFTESIEQLGGEPIEGSGVEDEAVPEGLTAPAPAVSVCSFGEQLA